MTARRFVLNAVVWGVLILLGPAAVAAQDAKDAEEFIRITGSKAVNSLTDEKISDQLRAERFRKLLVKTFDMPTIARFVLGRYWRLASEKQREEYLVLFEDFLVQAYSVQFKGLPGKFNVLHVRELNARDRLVLTEVQTTKGDPVRINWRVRGPKDGKFLIVDVVFEGISMSVTQRDEFATVIRRRGGKVEGLLAALREKTHRSR